MAVRASVLGAGAWGTALAHLLARKGDDVSMWAYEADVADDINQRRENRVYLPEVELPANISATTVIAEALKDAELVVAVMPSHVVRRVMSDAAPHLPAGVPIVSASKGIENESLMTMSEVLEEVLPIAHHPLLSFLSGPSFAREVTELQPTAVSVAARFPHLAERVQQMMSGPAFRIYTTTDVVGVELGGALKNVIAIATGAAVGFGLKSNASAALITRGLAEISRLAVKRGANPLTLAGLSGMGDMVLTCGGGLSRNRLVGVKLGQGMKRDEILADMKQVAEGVKTAKSVHQLAEREGVDMPLCTTVYRMLYEDLPVGNAMVELMNRPLKRELQ